MYALISFTKSSGVDFIVEVESVERAERLASAMYDDDDWYCVNVAGDLDIDATHSFDVKPLDGDTTPEYLDYDAEDVAALLAELNA